MRLLTAPPVVLFLLAAAPAHARDTEEKDAPSAARLERRAHLTRLLDITEALDLTDDQALKLKTKLEQFDQKAHALHQELEAHMAVLHQAAGGDTGALTKVDASVKAVKALRDQMRDLDQKLFEQLSQGLDAQHKARLAITLSHMPWKMHDIMHGGHDQGHTHEH
jgi:hypothetical protein